jgi:hypothetical protein
MNENSVVSLRQKDEIDDPLTEILRTGARRLITRAVVWDALGLTAATVPRRVSGIARQHPRILNRAQIAKLSCS